MEPGLLQTLALVAGLVALTFFAEDAATISAVALGASGLLDPFVSFAACFAGIWLGDLGLYAAARKLRASVLRRPFVQRFVPPDSLARAEDWFRRRGLLALVLARVVPGTRLPTYLAAGTLRMPLRRFAIVTGLGAAVWVAIAFALGTLLDVGALLKEPARATTVVLVGLVVVLTVRMLSAALRAFLGHARRWEFWPAWLFYAPVGVMCFWLGVRYRGFLLPTVANTSQKNGGIVGESKIGVLRELMAVAPGIVADAYELPPASLTDRMAALRSLHDEHGLAFPFVLKPDTAQRGAGFKKIENWREAESYLVGVNAPLVVQRYAPGPREAGIFYYRFPDAARGDILAITEKVFPFVTGDGRRTLAELIAADERARLIARTYLQRFADKQDTVVPAGERLRLVEAGNHCQGCIFQDGWHLYSEELRRVIDQISRALPGFCIGRYDVRYTSENELRAGRGFIIVELNGAASEATNIYDARNSLWSAYRTLYRQWELVYAIGAENRRRGARATTARSLWRDWRDYQRQAVYYPPAD
jgi:membrane protein DedA with SNARE-associated domain